MAGHPFASVAPHLAVRGAAELRPGRRLLRLAWGLLASCVVFGVIAMHSLAGGQHTAHVSTTVEPAATSHQGHDVDEGGSVGAGSSLALASGAALAATVTGHPQSAAGCGDGCDDSSVMAMCLALLLTLTLATVARRAGSWAASWRRPTSPAATLTRRTPMLPPPRPARFGISRT